MRADATKGEEPYCVELACSISDLISGSGLFKQQLKQVDHENRLYGEFILYSSAPTSLIYFIFLIFFKGSDIPELTPQQSATICRRPNPCSLNDMVKFATSPEGMANSKCVEVLGNGELAGRSRLLSHQKPNTLDSTETQ